MLGSDVDVSTRQPDRLGRHWAGRARGACPFQDPSDVAGRCRRRRRLLLGATCLRRYRELGVTSVQQRPHTPRDDAHRGRRSDGRVDHVTFSTSSWMQTAVSAIRTNVREGCYKETPRRRRSGKRARRSAISIACCRSAGPPLDSAPRLLVRHATLTPRRGRRQRPSSSDRYGSQSPSGTMSSPPASFSHTARRSCAPRAVRDIEKPSWRRRVDRSSRPSSQADSASTSTSGTIRCGSPAASASGQARSSVAAAPSSPLRTWSRASDVRRAAAAPTNPCRPLGRGSPPPRPIGPGAARCALASRASTGAASPPHAVPTRSPAR